MGRWSEHHDQRKGQWIVNHLRFNYGQRDNEGRVLFGMSNAEFDALMKEYDEKSEPTNFTKEQQSAFQDEDHKLDEPFDYKAIMKSIDRLQKEGKLK